MSLDINKYLNQDLDFEEMEKLIAFSNDQDTLVERYILACQIITNLTSETQPAFKEFGEAVDLSICKMLMDGVVEIEQTNTSYH
jgi:hypothetical protein